MGTLARPGCKRLQMAELRLLILVAHRSESGPKTTLARKRTNILQVVEYVPQWTGSALVPLQILILASIAELRLVLYPC